jgi:hypothetical protein
MHSSRAVGISGASLIVCAVLYEVSKFLTFLSGNEGSIGIAAIRTEIYLAGLAIIVAITAMFRIVVLAARIKWFGWQIFSWFLLSSVLCLYIWLRSPSNPSEYCDENGVCFGIYDMRDYTNWVAIAGTIYILFSVVRFLFTSAYIFVRQRIR